MNRLLRAPVAACSLLLAVACQRPLPREEAATSGREAAASAAPVSSAKGADPAAVVDAGAPDAAALMLGAPPGAVAPPALDGGVAIEKEAAGSGPLAIRRPGSEGPLRIWTMGDSTAQPVGQAIENLTKTDTRFKARTFYKNSSGLINQTKADWYAIAKRELTTSVPDVLIVSLGPNDAIDMLSPDKKTRYSLASEPWVHEYARRMAGFAKMFEDRGVRVYLSGHVYDPAKHHGPLMKAIDAGLAEAGGQLSNGRFFDTLAHFTNDDGTFKEQSEAPNGKIWATRGHDKLHLTGAGGHSAGKALLALIAKDFALAPPPPGKAAP